MDEPTNTPQPSRTWRSRIDASRRRRSTLVDEWKRNVDYRIGKPFAEVPLEDTVNVPVDWSRTKNKIAQLFFQVPKIQTRARRPETAGAGQVYAAALNYQLEHKVKAHVMMDEVLGDVINAAGIGVCMIGYDGVYDEVQLPAQDTALLPPAQQDFQALTAQTDQPVQPPVQTVARPIYECYYAKRISPAQFLWPADFTGSDWQECEWLGYEGRITRAEALRRKWIDESYRCEDAKLDTVNDQSEDAETKAVGRYVKYVELFHKIAATDPSERDPRKIGRLVFVEGKDDPVVNEPIKWQQYNAQSRQWIGLTTFPIKVLTLTSISDQDVPPSDSQIGRPQVRELTKSRSQMLRQRDRSLPLRWFDVNQVDPEVAEQIRKGVVQDMIPMNGPGAAAIGEVARANYPRENFEFQRVIDSDLDEAWSMGPNQMGFATPGDTSATEAQIMQQSASAKLDYERARVLRFFLEVAEGIGSLMQLFQDTREWVELTGPGGEKVMAAWDKMAIRGDFLFEAKPDAAQRVDVGQKRVEILNVYKLLRRDPMVNAAALVSEVLQLHGMDPSKVMGEPPKEGPKPAALRYTFKGEDLTNPVVVALIQKNSAAPIEPPDIEAAKLLMQDAGIPVIPPRQLPIPEEQLPQAPEDGAVNPGHPGPADVVQPLNRRYEQSGSDKPAEAE